MTLSPIICPQSPRPRKTAAIDDQGHLLYEVNGRSILVRGAGWTSEMMLRYSAERFEQELLYVKDMGLNTVRPEGKLEWEEFFDIADREGIMVMPGWCCCHYWEEWDRWTEKDPLIAVAQLRDQILRLRGRKLMGCNFSLPRASFETVNGYDEEFDQFGGEDYDLGLRLRNAGFRMTPLINRGCAYHLYHPMKKTGDELRALRAKREAEQRTWCERGLDRHLAVE